MFTSSIYEMVLKMVFYRLLMKCVERIMAEGIVVTHGGGMMR